MAPFPAERHIGDSEQQLRDVLDQSSDLIQATSPDGRLRYVNRAWQAALGYSTEEAAGLRVDDIVASEHRSAFREAMTAALAGSTPPAIPIDTIFVTRDERRLVVSGTISCRTEHGVPVETRGWFQNVTPQRRAEDAQRRLVATLEATTDFVGIGSVAGLTVYVNRAGRRIAGIAPDADVTQRPMESFYAERARELVRREAMPAAMRDGTWQGESVLLGGDGREIPVSQVIIAHASPRGGVWFVSTIMRDISEWKRLDRMKTEFVSTVSHELRTPLTSIRGSLGLLEGGAAGTLPAQAQELVRIARGNAERLIRLVNDMLDLDKIEAGKLEMHPGPLTAAEIVRVAIEEMEALGEQHGVRFETSVRGEHPFIGDRDRILQVLTNLLSNAVKFSPRNSVVTVAAEAPAVDPAEPGEQDDATGRAPWRAAIRFTVRNPGPGIAASDHARLFTRFQQLDGSDGRRSGGTGLGLAICKAIVEEHGGRIGVDSEAADATTFWFELPASPVR
jgi:PAS domain S-box-containing protein